MVYMSKVVRRTAAESWPLNSGWGNHRIVVEVDQPANAVLATVEWRRRDLEPEKIGVRVKYLETGEEIKLLYIKKATREEGEIVFNAPYKGTYAIYYLPFEIKGRVWFFPQVNYMKVEDMPKVAQWKQTIGAEVSKARVIAIESRTDFDRFDPMEVPATTEEVQRLMSRYSEEPFLLFPEERIYPIRMLRELPQRWIKKGPGTFFKGTAQPGEYYVFQIGVWALRDLFDMHIIFEDIDDEEGISASSLTCFNIHGTDWLGSSFDRSLNVEAGSIQALWFGIDLPENALGQYSFCIRIVTHYGERTVHIVLDVKGEVLVDRGDKDLWRLSRLRWLNSPIGIDEETTKGYPPIEVQGNQVSCWGRDVNFANQGLPSSIHSYFAPTGDRIMESGEELLSSNIEIKATSGGKVLDWDTGQIRVEKVASRRSIINASMTTKEISGSNKTIMEYDGHIDTIITLVAEEDIELDNFQLLIPIRRQVATYMMGMGKEGGMRPKEWKYEWDVDRANNMLWIGAPHAGLQIKLKHTEDVWEITNYRKQGLPLSWSNQGKGGCIITEKDDYVLVDAFTGSFSLKAGQSKTWRFALLITPLKPIDTDAHWQQRYYHTDTWKEDIPSLEEAAKVGATVVNLHQGGALNQYINYPFFKSREIQEQTKRAHELGLKYKIYYTVRELSNHAQELWMLRSLGDEVLREGEGFHVADHFTEDRHHLMTGGPWQCEHLVEGFVPAWQQILHDGDYDSAVAMSGLSRWHNYYLEGLSWLIRKDGLDGIYLDGVGYDREIMKRVRKTMDSAKEGCLIDFHSGNNFEPQYGMNSPMNQYLELMPSIDSLWLGEGYDYEKKSADYWLVEVSGIPFGLMGDMLQNGGNPWRGMVFGMTARYGWQQGGDPTSMWNFWKSFGIIGSRMHGWWSEGCPVITDNDDIKATAFIKDDKTLIAIASWASKSTDIQLKIDWGKLGISSENAVFEAPCIEDFQESQIFEANERIPVEPGKGWLLILRNK